MTTSELDKLSANEQAVLKALLYLLRTIPGTESFSVVDVRKIIQRRSPGLEFLRNELEFNATLNLLQDEEDRGLVGNKDGKLFLTELGLVKASELPNLYQ